MLHNLINNMQRAEVAYQKYKICPNYHHAKHIYHANKTIYEELNKLLSQPANFSYDIKQVIDYIFHLEDWFLQFEKLEGSIEDLEQEFIFMPFKSFISFPQNFKESIGVGDES